MKGSPSPPPLLQFYAYITDRCNCACRHCWIIPDAESARSPAETSDGGRAHFLDPALFDLAVREAKPLGLQSVKWTGGEPTIHPQLPRLLRLQHEHGLTGHMETNGIEMTPSLARLLQDTGVDHVAVSIDGASAATHDAIRGSVGAHAAALRGVGYLVDAGFRPQIILSLFRDNIGEVDDLIALAERIGAGSVKINIVQPTLRGEDLHSAGEVPDVTEILALASRLRIAEHRVVVVVDVPVALRPISSLLGESGGICGIKTILGLLADGSYALCGIGTHVPEMVFGRVGRDALVDVWRDHPVLREVREALPDGLQGVCGRCVLKSACLGACAALNHYRCGKLTGPYWLCESAEALGVFPASRTAPFA